MNYPVWELTAWGGGWLIALVAVVHVYVAHFAVGGGLFLVLTETAALKRGDGPMLDYTRRHAKFFLLLTTVFGGMTGVAIWLIISVLHPGATSLLIHTFVFGWATEWVCFVGEIVAIFVYYYTFGKMEPRKHLIMGWLYFIFAWLSLVLIDGIIAFMLTPGGWPASKDFWDGFLNPSFLPSAAFRTFLALVLAGVYGFLTAVAIKEPGFRQRMIRWCAAWLLAPFLLMLLAGWWYLKALPTDIQAMILGANPEMVAMGQAYVWTAAALFLGGLVMALRLPARASRPLAVGLLIIGLLFMGAFEWMREAGRRPYIVHGYMYSNGLLADQPEQTRREGALKLARYSRHKEVTEDNRLAAGRELFTLLCSHCHAVGGPMHDILPMTAKYGLMGMDSQLDGMGKLRGYMPAFPGNQAERRALAAHIVQGLHNKQERPSPFRPRELANDIPPFDPKQDDHLLLAWAERGMHFMSDGGPGFILLPANNALSAQVVRRGAAPQLLGEGVEVAFRVEAGQDLSELAGVMAHDDQAKSFRAAGPPLTPYTQGGGFNPYPLFTVEAKDKQSGRVLARTQAVVPASTEMGCKNCHGGSWRVADAAGLAPATIADVLATHDRINRTGLKDQARAGRPVACASCHADSAQGAAGDGKRLSLSAAMHGWHANYLTGRGEEACAACHPSSPTGATRSYRGLHAQMGQTCLDCHGHLEDHALSLLKKEQEAGKPQAAALMRHLKPRAVTEAAAVKPREPWKNLPDCLSCHQDFGEPSGGSAFNRWTAGEQARFGRRADEVGVRCAACHGSAHALYPAKNPYGAGRDSIQPRQYQGNALPLAANNNCQVCHKENIYDEAHHPGSLRTVRSLPME